MSRLCKLVYKLSVYVYDTLLDGEDQERRSAKEIMNNDSKEEAIC